MPYRIYSPFTKSRIGFRGASLMSLGIMEVIIGWSILDAKPEQYRFLTLFRYLPQTAMGWAWAIPGIVAILMAFFRTPARDRLGFVLAYVMPFLWGSFYLISWCIFRDLTLLIAFRAAILYWGYAMLILVISGWSEPVVIYAFKDRK